MTHSISRHRLVISLPGRITALFPHRRQVIYTAQSVCVTTKTQRYVSGYQAKIDQHLGPSDSSSMRGRRPSYIPGHAKPRSRWLFWTTVTFFAVQFADLTLVSYKDAQIAQAGTRAEREAAEMARLEARGFEMTEGRRAAARRFVAAEEHIVFWLLRNSATSWAQLRAGEPASLLLAPLTHDGIPHLLASMVAFGFASRTFIAAFPGGRVALLIWGSALSGSALHYVSSALMGDPERRVLGAGPMTAGIVAALAMTQPLRNIWDLGITLAVQMAYEVYRDKKNIKTPFIADKPGYASYVGGAAFGILFGRRMRL